MPGLEAKLRVWAKDSDGMGHGYCKAYDTYEYLLMCGHIDGKRNGFKIVNFGDHDVTGKKLTFPDLKKYVLAADLGSAEKKEASKLLGFNKYVDIREACFEEIRSGRGYKLMTDRNQAKGIKASSSEEDLEVD